MLASSRKYLNQKCTLSKLSLSRMQLHVSSILLWKVMFFGTDDFSLKHLKRLHKEFQYNTCVTKLEIVTSSWKWNPVRIFGVENNLLVHEWPIQDSLIKDFDIGLVASFGHLIPHSIISAYPLGMLNVHASILPRWRGAAPVVHAVLNGDSKSGITIMRIRPHKFDEGEIVSMKETPVSLTETATNLRERLACLGADELVSVLHRLPDILQSTVPQPQEGVTYAPKVTPALGELRFKEMTAREVYNRYRALSGTVPVTATWLESILRLEDISLSEDGSCSECHNTSNITNTDKRPGQIIFNKRLKTIVVLCKGGGQVKVGRIASMKRKMLSSSEFFNGYLSKQDRGTWFLE